MLYMNAKLALDSDQLTAISLRKEYNNFQNHLKIKLVDPHLLLFCVYGRAQLGSGSLGRAQALEP